MRITNEKRVNEQIDDAITKLEADLLAEKDPRFKAKIQGFIDFLTNIHRSINSH